MTLIDFLKKYKTMKEMEMLATKLGVKSRIIYRWRKAEFFPNRKQASKLRKLSGGKLDGESIYRVKDFGKKIA